MASRAAKAVCDENRGVGPGGRGVFLDFSDAIARQGEAVVRERYGNLFDMYERITAETPTKFPCASTRPCTTPWAACGSTII